MLGVTVNQLRQAEMGTLPPKLGQKILDIMAKTPKSDQTMLNRKIKEVQSYFLARQNNA